MFITTMFCTTHSSIKHRLFSDAQLRNGSGWANFLVTCSIYSNAPIVRVGKGLVFQKFGGENSRRSDFRRVVMLQDVIDLLPVIALGTEAVAEGYYREQVDDILKHYNAAEVA